MKTLKRGFLFLICIMAIIFFIFALDFSFEKIEGIASATISDTLIYKDFQCYKGTDYYHYINIYMSAQDGTKDGTTYYTKSSITLRYSRGSHNSGGGLLADGKDMAGTTKFVLCEENGNEVQTQQFYQRYYWDNIDAGSDSGNIVFTNLNAGTYILRVSSNYYRSSTYDQSYSSWLDIKFIVDTTVPQVSAKTSNNVTLQNKNFTNREFTVSASDTYFDTLYYKYPGDALFKSTKNTSLKVAKDNNRNGEYQFYATDKSGNKSSTISIYLDTAKPILTGVSSGGFYRTQVTLKWDTTILFNSNDAITAKYSMSTGGSFPTSSATTFNSGTNFDKEGNYRVSLSDKAGNENIYNFTIDKSAPTLTLEGVNSKNFAKDNVKATWLTTVGGVKAQRMNSSDGLTVYYAISTNSTFPKADSATTPYNNHLTKEGNYTIKIVDKAGNYTSYQFTIDKTAPTLTINGLLSGLSFYGSKDGFSVAWDTAIGGAGTQLTNANDGLTAMYSMTEQPQFPNTATTTYTRNTLLNVDGYYKFTLTDNAGNASVYNIIVDKTAPTVSKLSEYLNYEFTYNVEDLHKTTIHYIFNGNVEQTTENNSFTVKRTAQNYGAWTFWAVDEFGNRSTAQTIKFYYRNDFGNLENIKNGYKVSTWYTVTLPAKIYTQIAGNYSFRTQEDALNFAIAKEWDYRVEKLDSGWSYVNITNESVSQIYTVRAELDKAILKYASSYISERKEMRLGTNTYPNPTDSNGVVRDDALTLQNLTYPSILSEYANLPLFFIRHEYQFIQPIAGVSGNTRKAIIRYIANDFALSNGVPIELDYGVAIEKQLSDNGAYKQGYYLVEESDLCGNYQSYVVYIDNDMPTLSALAVDGKGEQTSITFTNDYVIQNAGVMLYVSLDLQSILDNIDECIMLCVSGRGMNDKIFVRGDEFPTLNLENGYYGRYTINVYDRSLNYLSFNIRIAGELPYLTHTSLTNETRCALTVNYDSANNGITEVHIFKVSYLGEYTELFYDSDGTPISSATLSYILRTGGKYVVRFTDIFGREIETEPLFYMKGLPSGTLKGVKEGGITNNDVSFEYIDGNSIYFYAYVNKEWIRYDEILVFVEKEGYTIASITANADTSLIYKFFLYVDDDLNLFTEYKFEIDCIAPIVTISNTDGTNVIPETVTTTSFSVDWNEANATARYYNTKDALGHLGESAYQKNTVITKAGTYVFTVRDAVGNETVFTITLDNVVSYTIDGRYSLLEDGSYISKYDLVLTVTERTSKFLCTASNGVSIVNGSTISEDGTYRFEICDAYGNTLSLTIIIDKLPPVPIIMTQSQKQVQMNGSTNEGFVVSCDEKDVKISIKSGTQYQNYDGTVLVNEGVYTFRLVDRMSNSVTFTITIDKTVNFKIVGTYKLLDDGSYISRNTLSISMSEDYSSFTVSSNTSLTFLPNEKVDVEGIFDVVIVDSIGNVANVRLIIDKTPPTPKIIADDGSEILYGKTNKPFIVSCDEQGSTIKIANSASASGSTYLGEQLSEVGIYYFRLTDFIGNEIVFSIEIDVNVGFTVKGNYKRSADGAYVSSKSLSIVMNEQYKTFLITDGLQELSIMPGDEITQEGTYSVVIEDLAGNRQDVLLIIDRTAPTASIISESGKNVEPNQIIKEGFIVGCDEKETVIKISTNGTKYSIYDGALCSVDNVYFFIVSDLVGNEIEFTVEIDLGIDFIIRGTYIHDGNRYYSKSGLMVDVREDIATFIVQSTNGTTFKANEQIDIEGEYQVTIIDIAGNTAIIELVIDKSAPTPIIRTLNGDIVDINSATRFPFTVSSEDGANITYSTSNFSKYEIYDGATINVEKTYYFTITDYVGNEISFSVTLDMSVGYVIKGAYVVGDDGTVYSRNGIAFQLSEPYKTFTVNGATDQSIIAGEKITAEGMYQIYIEDMQGNIADFYVVIDITAPIISANVENGGASKYSVKISIEGAVQAYYRNSNGDVVNIDLSCVISDNGTYTVVAKDLVGNESTYKFDIDMYVDVTISPMIVSGQISAEPISFKFNEQVMSTLWFNGEEIPYSSKPSNSGNYRLRSVDDLGNVFELEWTIISPISNMYEFNIPTGYNARLISGDTVTDLSEQIKLDKDGIYTIEFFNDVNSYTVEITVDTVAPTVEITQEKNQVSFSKADKDNVTYTLYLDGEEIKASPNSAITARGKYKLVVTDELGNTSIYNFELDYINTYGIVVIVVLSVVVVAVAISVIVYRKKQSVK